MVNQRAQAGQTVTRRVLAQELSSLEKRFDGRMGKLDEKIDSVERRLDAKIDFSVQSMKEYMDSRFTVAGKDIQSLRASIEEVNQTVLKQGTKMDRYFEGIVKMVEGLTGRESQVEERLDNHERRITILETKS